MPPILPVDVSELLKQHPGQEKFIRDICEKTVVSLMDMKDFKTQVGAELTKDQFQCICQGHPVLIYVSAVMQVLDQSNILVNFFKKNGFSEDQVNIASQVVCEVAKSYYIMTNLTGKVTKVVREKTEEKPNGRSD